MNEIPYRYYGNIATTICPNGHFGIREGTCPVCELSQSPLRFLTVTTRLPIDIYGYSAKDGSAVIINVDGELEYGYSQKFFVRTFCCPTVNDFHLLVSRMFSWGVITKK